MAATTEDHVCPDKKTVLALCAGSSLVKGQIIFSHDSKYLFCCSGSVIKVFNTTNGQCTQLLCGHNGAVTGLAINPANKLQLFSCGEDGSVNQWDYSDGVLLKTHKFHMPLHGFVSLDPSARFVTAIAYRQQSLNCSLVRLPLKKNQNSKQSGCEDTQQEKTAVKTNILIPVCSADHRKVSQGFDGDLLASVHGNELSVYSIKKKTLKKLTKDKTDPFTCVACHPTECCLATGHASGKINFWWNVFSKDKIVSSSHWHSLPVQSLAFTPEGSYLLSGGHECVLVKWQVNSEQKDFLPRLGAPLSSISSSPDGTLYVTSHTDNVLQVISSNFRILHAIRGLARAHLGSEAATTATPVPVGLLCDPRSSALVTNGRPGHLQFYCMNTDTQLFNLDIVGQNYISPNDLKKPAAVTEVEHAAFDTTGDWLVTFEQWDDGKMTPEYRLKFWCYIRKQQNYQLNTTVENPHSKPLSCLQFRPRGTGQSSQPLTVVSTSADGFFMLWTMVTEKHLNRNVERWVCDAVGYYRDLPASLARFSEDGSVLAVTFQRTLTLWETSSNVMKATLSLPSSNEEIKFLEFGGKSCSHLVVTTTASHLTVWNAISLSIHLRVSLNVAVLCTDGDLMAVVTTDQDLYVFRPNSWEPVFMKEKAFENPATSAIFLPQAAPDREVSGRGALDWQHSSRLYVLDSRQQLFTPQYSSDVTSAPRRTAVELQQSLPQTPFSSLLASAGRLGAKVDSTSSANRPAGTVWHRDSASSVFDVMNIPVATLEPFHKICSQYIESLLLKNKSDAETVKEDTDEEEGDEEQDVSMETDSS